MEAPQAATQYNPVATSWKFLNAPNMYVIYIINISWKTLLLYTNINI